MYQSKNWCFTDYELLNWNNIFNSCEDIRYICFGEEICPKTNKDHIQGWIQLNKKKTIGGVKKLLNTNKLHLEACRGSEFDNDKYCSKDGKFIKLGKFIRQGQRLDLEDIVERMKNGEKLIDIAEEDPMTYCKYRNGLKDIEANIIKKKLANFNKDTEVIYIHGETGTGKSSYVWNNYDQKNVYKAEGSNLQWFDGYEGEDILWIDEYSNDIPIEKLLNLTDRYALKLPVKGGFTYRNWTKVIITSNLDPAILHSNAREVHRKALFRRITKIINL